MKKILCIVALLVLCGCGYRDYSHVLKANWSFAIPKESGYELLMEKDSGPSFHGDGIRFHMYAYENEEALLKMFDWKDENLEDRAEEYLGKIDVHEDIAYGKCRSYSMNQDDGSEIIILFDRESKRLYIIESFL